MEFVVEHDLGSTRAVILGRQGKYGEAVRQYLDENQESEALDLALEHIDEVAQDSEAFNAIVETFLWRYISFGCRGWPESADIPSHKIDELLGNIPGTHLSDRDKKTVCDHDCFLQERQLTSAVQLFIFRLIFQEVKSEKAQKILCNHVLRCESLSLDSQARAVRLLAFDYIFDDVSLAFDISSQDGVVSSMELFHQYSLLIRDVAIDKTPWDSSWLMTLFQFEKDGEGVRIRPGTFLYQDYRAREPSPNQSAEDLGHGAVTLSREAFAQNLSRALSERLYPRIKDKDRTTARLRLFDPCIPVIVHGACRGGHSFVHHLDVAWFNRRARYHLQHIMILDNLYAFGLLDDFPARMRNQR